MKNYISKIKANTHFVFFVLLVVQAILCRAVLFISSTFDFEENILLRKIVSGLLSDFQVATIVTLLIILLSKIFNLSYKSIRFSYLFSSLCLGALYLINIMLYKYFSSGLASIGILIEYIKDLPMVVKMGVGGFNPIPMLAAFIIPPLTLLFFRNKKHNNGPIKSFVIGLILIFVFSNQVAKLVRVNKKDVLETSVIYKMIKGEETNLIVFRTVNKIEKNGLKKQDYFLLRGGLDKREYLSKAYPLLKREKLKPLGLNLKRPNIIIFGLESVSAFSTGIKQYFSNADQELFKNYK